MIMNLIVNDIREKIKRLRAKAEETPLFLSFIIILVAFASFGLGRLSLLEERKAPVRIENTILEKNANDTTKIEGVENIMINDSQSDLTKVIASKNGTKYYYSWCGGISRISEQNKVTFSSAKEAESAGYSIAANCVAP